MNDLYRPHASNDPWGPIISPNFKDPATTNSDVLVSSIPWALTLVNFIIAIWQGYKQTKAARDPLRSSYVWMIWVAMMACFSLGLLAYLHVLRYVPSSFALYFGNSVCWAVQVMCVFQIIINRIRVIDINRERSNHIFLGVTTYISMVIITAFVLWLPAQMQISDRWTKIGIVWDRTEKSIFLVLDLALNWYFLRTVRTNLITNGITKYKQLVRFNERIIVLSLLMDVMLIAATAMPKTWVYILFHPLCYLVKLNIEMAMADLIKRIAITNSRLPGMSAVANEYKSSCSLDTTDSKLGAHTSNQSSVELDGFAYHPEPTKCVVSILNLNQIRSTTEHTVTSETNLFAGRGSERQTASGHRDGYGGKQNGTGKRVEEVETRSLGSSAGHAESLQESEMTKRVEDSDDEVVLVGRRVLW
ncbi:hypothetical protein HBI67_077200 [Parastagonospora nodorum]|nr:hypothetical protein HBI79_235010 [Parastagonospora nodorum]KAH5292881.1 hypothetical protein HBI12_233710 [Parastagonospora nodorum]KAH5446657.1 hypothetical protein HBI47_016320 [Parastagonospora nodorum]KAH6073121.1 hypothetical protein HBI67_077200 [Parastagonospora nodorum]KAH6076105.1 hypothetical protein HBI66_099450 [Parastagonospora nodorum]